MARRTLAKEVVNGILSGLKNGERPADLAVKYSVSVPTIYNYRKSIVVVAAEKTAELENTAGC